MGNVWLVLGSLSGALAVGMGAFGAHGLENILEANQQTDVYQTAAEYHFVHSLALLAVGLLALRVPSKSANVAGWSFLLGILLFSGSLYALGITNFTKLGAIAPFGGTAFIVGWIALALAGWKKPEHEPMRPE